MGHAMGQAVIAGLGMLLFIGIILIVRTLSKGVDKVKEIKSARDEEIAKVDFIIEKLTGFEVIPSTGKVEYIHFYLDNEDESAFYAISPEHLKRLRPKLENLISYLEQNEISYGHQYAERRFYIGDKLIFQWRKEVKI